MAFALVEYFNGGVGLRGLQKVDARMAEVLFVYLRESKMVIRSDDPEATIYVLLQAIRGTIFMSYAAAKPAEELARIRAQLIELCVRYLEPVEGE